MRSERHKSANMPREDDNMSKGERAGWWQCDYCKRRTMAYTQERPVPECCSQCDRCKTRRLSVPECIECMEMLARAKWAWRECGCSQCVVAPIESQTETA